MSSANSMSSMLFSIVTFIYFFSAVFYISNWIFKKDIFGKIGSYSIVMAVIGNSIGIIMRWIESYRMGMGHAPLSNMYESLIFFSWAITAIYLFVEFKYKNRIIGSFVTPIAFLAMAYAALSPDQIRPLVPALKSNWLIAHVVTCFLGYAGFAISFGVSIMYVIKNRSHWLISGRLPGLIPNADILEDLTHRMVMFGFLFLTVGIITGSVWANSAWGSYWSWDPKETWSLITWLIYSFLLHARLMRGWTGDRIAYISILGFMAVLFTFFGVNYLPGLHSYGK